MRTVNTPNLSYLSHLILEHSKSRGKKDFCILWRGARKYQIYIQLPLLRFPVLASSWQVYPTCQLTSRSISPTLYFTENTPTYGERSENVNHQRNAYLNSFYLWILSHSLANHWKSLGVTGSQRNVSTADERQPKRFSLLQTFRCRRQPQQIAVPLQAESLTLLPWRRHCLKWSDANSQAKVAQSKSQSNRLGNIIYINSRCVCISCRLVFYPRCLLVFCLITSVTLTLK